MGAPGHVLDLMERFERNHDAYRSPAYNETQVRREFIDPLFKALGWDIDNTAGHAEAYKDVVHEDAIKVGGLTKAPDYSFRVGGTRKFFVEAKKPAANVKGDVAPAFQLRRYAWSAKLPLSVLTDFEEFAVYDCRVRPDKTDAAATARTIYLPYTSYDARWEEIASVFSKEAILQGSFDRYADTTKGKKGTAEVDAAFLKEIEEWRDSLARTIALRNPSLTQRELNFAVQTTIDRIIFLRICEDRGIESYGELQALCNGVNTYSRLLDLYVKADQRYNSGLFHFTRERGRGETPDTLTPGLVIDDKALKAILKRLYYPDSPYEFSVLPADILGQVYEQFLGKVIRLTAGHRAVVEDKPEVKKAGGVYYTPTYIVDYIVKTTVGKLLEGSTPKKASSLRILDPACGSGSFLIGAFQYLVDWHRDWYVQDVAQKHTKEVFLGRGGEWRLTTAEKKRLLLNNIYGVDIDAQAVETTKLSLLLKVLEGETSETINAQLSFLHERALPDLANNIKCGNSLIGPDFYEGQQPGLLDDEERYRINVFDWEAEFPQMLGKAVPETKRGFDAVIGNPPYIRMEQFKQLKTYLKAGYASHDERSDLYAYFVERGHRLLAPHGRFGMIVSNKFLRAKYGAPLRSLLESGYRIEGVVDFAGLPVFKGATVRTVVILSERCTGAAESTCYTAPASRADFAGLVSGSKTVADLTAERFLRVHLPGNGEAWSFLPTDRKALLDRLTEIHPRLAEYTGGRIMRGVVSGLSEAFVIDDQTRYALCADNPEAGEVIKPFIVGRDVRRYRLDSGSKHLLYMFHGVDPARYPGVIGHLHAYRERLLGRATQQAWYELQQPQLRFAKYMDAPKIVFPDIATGPRFAMDSGGHYGSNTTYFIPGEDYLLLGLLNSALARFYFESVCAGLEGPGEVYLRFFGQYMEGFPVPRATDEGSAATISALARNRTGLEVALAGARTPQDEQSCTRQVAALDCEIDRLVYRLYGLTDAEIALVESSFEKGAPVDA